MDKSKIKTFEASSLSEALKVIKKELGPDAIVLETREKKSRFGLLNKASVEVKATVNPRAQWKMSATSQLSAESDLENCLSWGLTRLIRSGISEGHTRNVAHATLEELKKAEIKKLSKEEMLWHLKKNMRSKIKISSPIAERIQKGAAPKVISLIGPTGVGKTTTLAKMAASLKKSTAKRIVLATSDTFKIAAIDHLRTYAKMLHLPFAVCRDLNELKALVVQCSDRDLVLLDTLGVGPKDSDKMSELSLVLNNIPIESHLCLSATTKGDDLDYLVEQFSVFNPQHLIFTKLDESSRLGELYNVMVNTGLPLSYMTTGQKVPSDIEIADKNEFIEQILKK